MHMDIWDCGIASGGVNWGCIWRFGMVRDTHFSDCFSVKRQTEHYWLSSVYEHDGAV